MFHLKFKLPSRKWRVIGGLVLILLAFAAYKVSVSSAKGELLVKTVEVKNQELAANIYTTGTLQAAQQQDIYAKSTTWVKQVVVEAGKSVTPGEPIILLDDVAAIKELAQAQSELATSQNQYQQSKAQQGFNEKKLALAKNDLERTEKLYKVGAVSQKELETAQMSVAEAEKEILSVDLQVLEDQVAKNKQAVLAAQQNLTDMVVTSPLGGTVLKVAVKEGQPVNSGTLLCSTGTLDNMEALSSVNEFDAMKVKTGQEVEIYSEGMPDQKYRGHVIQVAPLAEQEQTATGTENKVKVKIALDDKIRELKPGFSINIRIIVDKRSNTLAIPLEALSERDGKPVVFVYKNGMAEMRKVQTGISNELYQEITGGISSGEMVITSSLDKLADKAKVRIK